MSSHATQETEIKLSVASLPALRRTLRAAGFRVFHRRVFESNTIFDTAVPSLRPGGTLLRLRQAGPVVTLTYKGVASAAKHKSREELEVQVADHAGMCAVLGRLGYQPTFRYEKYRTEFREPVGEGIAMLDETPIGVYMELEGTPEWIDRAAHALGFCEADYITASYGRLYQQWCEAHATDPTHMTFA